MTEVKEKSWKSERDLTVKGGEVRPAVKNRVDNLKISLFRGCNADWL